MTSSPLPVLQKLTWPMHCTVSWHTVTFRIAGLQEQLHEKMHCTSEEVRNQQRRFCQSSRGIEVICIFLNTALLKGKPALLKKLCTIWFLYYYCSSCSSVSSLTPEVPTLCRDFALPVQQDEYGSAEEIAVSCCQWVLGFCLPFLGINEIHVQEGREDLVASTGLCCQTTLWRQQSLILRQGRRSLNNAASDKHFTATLGSESWFILLHVALLQVQLSLFFWI